MDIYVVKKRKKNASIRIENDGKIVVSVPLYYTDKMTQEFIKKYEPWIKKNLDKAIDYTLSEDIYEGATIYLLGKAYIIRLITSNKEYTSLDDGFINIYLKDSSKADKIYQDFKTKYIKEVYQNTLNKYLNLTNESINSFKIKYMKSALGKCYYKKREIIMNSTLIHKDIKYLEAVMLHEIAHLKYPNHQKEFYDYILSYMPDYKERMKEYKNNK